jgi:hypothetical protein
MKESYGTISQTIDGLKKDGYTLDFNAKSDCIVCQQTQTELSPESFEIDKVYRFEGDSDPGDEAVVYAISSRDHGMKGTLVNGYGVSADEWSADLVKKLNIYHT